MNEIPQGGFVQVAVPAQHVIAVYALLAELEHAKGGEADTAPPPEAEDDATEEETWPVEDLRRFAATPTATSATIGKVLDVLAATPDTYLSTTELEARTGIARANLKGAFSALTRHINKHYGRRGWMLTFEWGPQLGPGYPAEGHYLLSQEQASRWQQARSSE